MTVTTLEAACVNTVKYEKVVTKFSPGGVDV